ETTFADHRFDDHCGDVLGRYVTLEEIFHAAHARQLRRGPVVGVFALQPMFAQFTAAVAAPVAVRVRDAINLRRGRAEAGFVSRLARERDAEQRAPMKGILESDDRLPSGVMARQLDRVLNSFDAAVDEESALLEIARRQ